MTAVPRILVVDDDPDVRELVVFTLGVAGYELHTAEDGHAALASALMKPPDLVVLDWMLPELDGIGVCMELRNEPALQDVPIIMISARTGAQDRKRGLAAGVDTYLTKPFSPRDLIRTVESALAGAARRRARARGPVLTGDYLG